MAYESLTGCASRQKPSFTVAHDRSVPFDGIHVLQQSICGCPCDDRPVGQWHYWLLGVVVGASCKTLKHPVAPDRHPPRSSSGGHRPPSPVKLVRTNAPLPLFLETKTQLPRGRKCGKTSTRPQRKYPHLVISTPIVGSASLIGFPPNLTVT